MKQKSIGNHISGGKSTIHTHTHIHTHANTHVHTYVMIKATAPKHDQHSLPNV